MPIIDLANQCFSTTCHLVHNAITRGNLDIRRKKLLQRYMRLLTTLYKSTVPPRFQTGDGQLKVFVAHVNAARYSDATILLVTDWTLPHQIISYGGCEMTVERFIKMRHDSSASSQSERQGWTDMSMAVAVWRIVSYANQHQTSGLNAGARVWIPRWYDENEESSDLDCSNVLVEKEWSMRYHMGSSLFGHKSDKPSTKHAKNIFACAIVAAFEQKFKRQNHRVSEHAIKKWIIDSVVDNFRIMCGTLPKTRQLRDMYREVATKFEKDLIRFIQTCELIDGLDSNALERNVLKHTIIDTVWIFIDGDK